MKRIYSLKRNKEFRYVYRTGKSVACKCLALVYKKSKTDLPGIGFSVSKKIGKSVIRNKVKRRLREALTPMLIEIKPNCKLIFIAREPILREDFVNIARSMKFLLDKAGVLNESTEVTAKCME